MDTLKGVIDKTKPTTEKVKRTVLKRTEKIKPYRISLFFWKFFRIVLLVGLTYVILNPIMMMVVKSINTYGNQDSINVWVPDKIGTLNYRLAIEYLDYFKSLFLTIEVAGISALLQVIVSAIVGYGFARYKLKFKGVLIGLVALTILIPPQPYIMPLYINYSFYEFFGVLPIISKIFGGPSYVSIVNSPMMFWIPAAFGVGLRGGLFILIFMQFFKGLPLDLENAAKIDGCGHFKTFLRIMVPNVKPGFVTVFLFSLVWHWNDSTLSGILFNGRREVDPLSIHLVRVMSWLLEDEQARRLGNQTFDTMKVAMASCVLVMLPILIVYLVAQKHFVESIDGSILKG